jgi:hypothetical protein
VRVIEPVLRLVASGNESDGLFCAASGRWGKGRSIPFEDRDGAG